MFRARTIVFLPVPVAVAPLAVPEDVVPGPFPRAIPCPPPSPSAPVLVEPAGDIARVAFSTTTGKAGCLPGFGETTTPALPLVAVAAEARSGACTGATPRSWAGLEGAAVCGKSGGGGTAAALPSECSWWRVSPNSTGGGTTVGAAPPRTKRDWSGTSMSGRGAATLTAGKSNP